MRDIFIFFGPPGAGKGTLSALASSRLGWSFFSTGDACRKHISEGTKIGQSIDFAIKSGKLVSDDLIIQMVEHWLLNDAPKDSNLILDGCPRTLAQAEYLVNLIESKFPDCKLRVVELTSSDQVLVERILNRMVCSNKECQAVYSKSAESTHSKVNGKCDKCGAILKRRSDDTEEAIKERLQTYAMHAKPVLDFLSKKGIRVDKIDAERQIEKVFKDLEKLAV